MIRPADDKDFDRIMLLWQETNISAHHFVSTQYWQKHTSLVRNTYLPAAQTYVFVDRHQIKGFISLLDDNYIGACFVDRRFQNKKIGRKLIQYLQKRRNILQLHVYALNDKAVRFYRQQGFKVIRQDRQAETGQLQLLMCWSLGCPPNRFVRQKGDS